MIAIIVAYASNGAIGKDGKIPWHLPKDLARFQYLTIGDCDNAVIMGRKTWESLPERVRPLPNRYNIVVTSQDIDGVYTTNSLKNAILYAQLKVSGDVFLIGGQGIYEEGLQYADIVHATIVSKEVEDADAFFPVDLMKTLYRKSDWASIRCSTSNDSTYYTFLDYIRKEGD